MLIKDEEGDASKYFFDNVATLVLSGNEKIKFEENIFDKIPDRYTEDEAVNINIPETFVRTSQDTLMAHKQQTDSLAEQNLSRLSPKYNQPKEQKIVRY